MINSFLADEVATLSTFKQQSFYMYTSKNKRHHSIVKSVIKDAIQFRLLGHCPKCHHEMIKD